MDYSNMTLEGLRAALARIVELEDVTGRPDIHTEDLLLAEIARREGREGVSVYGVVKG
jgi:hypothetical protein